MGFQFRINPKKSSVLCGHIIFKKYLECGYYHNSKSSSNEEGSVT